MSNVGKVFNLSGGGGSGSPKMESLTIATPPNKTVYKSGETFDPTGMVVVANYGEGLMANVTGYVRQMDNFTIFGSSKRKLRKLLEDIKKWLAEIGMKIKGNWQIFRVGFTPKVERAHQALPKKKQRHRRPRLPSALGYRFGHGYTILRKHNLFRLKQSLHLYYYRRDRNRVISFKRASGLISRLGQLRKCNHQQVLDRHYQPKTMFDLKKVVRKECRRLQALYPPYAAA